MSSRYLNLLFPYTMSKHLTPADKVRIVKYFNTGSTLNELASIFNRHRTTIVRALEEHGIDPGIKRRSKPANKIQPVVTVNEVGLGQTMVDIDLSEPAPTATKTTWATRLRDKFVSSMVTTGRMLGMSL